MKTQNTIFLAGLNFLLNSFFEKVKISRIKIDIAIAITPPNFDGIDRKIA